MRGMQLDPRPCWHLWIQVFLCCTLTYASLTMVVAQNISHRLFELMLQPVGFFGFVLSGTGHTTGVVSCMFAKAAKNTECGRIATSLPRQAFIVFWEHFAIFNFPCTSSQLCLTCSVIFVCLRSYRTINLSSRRTLRSCPRAPSPRSRISLATRLCFQIGSLGSFSSRFWYGTWQQNRTGFGCETTLFSCPYCGPVLPMELLLWVRVLMTTGLLV